MGAKLFAALCWLVRPFARAFAREAYRELELEFANMAGAIAEDVKHELIDDVLHPFGLRRGGHDPLQAPPFPGAAEPLTTEQRAGLEKMRDRYAPDRQRTAVQPPPGAGVERRTLSEIRREHPPETANQP